MHKGFAVLDTVPHSLTSARVIEPALIHVVQPASIPNPNWLSPTTPSPNQQAFGDRLLQDHVFVLIPSAVSRFSWNLVFDANRAAGHFDDIQQMRFALDPRLQKSV